MIDGLKLRMTGEELRNRLEDRILELQECARRWREETDDEPLPEHMCENEAQRHEWQADVLGFIREHIESAEVYRLGESDLVFANLLPEKPEWMERAEFEERTSVGFHLGRLVKSVDQLTPSGCAVAPPACGGEEQHTGGR